MYITSAPLNKIIERIKDFYNIYIKSKYTKIIKHKAMTLKIQKLEEIYANIWGSHDLLFILRKIYIDLLLDKYTKKL